MNSHAPLFVSFMEQKHLIQQIKTKETALHNSYQTLNSLQTPQYQSPQQSLQFQRQCTIFNKINGELLKLKSKLQTVTISIAVNDISYAHNAEVLNALTSIDEKDANDWNDEDAFDDDIQSVTSTKISYISNNECTQTANSSFSTLVTTTTSTDDSCTAQIQQQSHDPVWKSEIESILDNMIMIGHGMGTNNKQTFANAILSAIRTYSMEKEEIQNLLNFMIEHGMTNNNIILCNSLCKFYVILCFDTIQCIPSLSNYKAFSKWIPLHKRQYIIGWFMDDFGNCLFRKFDIFRSNMIGAFNNNNNDDSANICGKQLQYIVVAIAEYYLLIDIGFGNQIFDHILDAFLSEEGNIIPNEKEIECLYDLLKRCGAKLQKLNGKRMDDYCSNLSKIADCEQYKTGFMKPYHTLCYIQKLKQNHWNY